MLTKRKGGAIINNVVRTRRQTKEYAGVVELADTYDSGSYAVTSMQVQVLSPAPITLGPIGSGVFCFTQKGLEPNRLSPFRKYSCGMFLGQTFCECIEQNIRNLQSKYLSPAPKALHWGAFFVFLVIRNLWVSVFLF